MCLELVGEKGRNTRGSGGRLPSSATAPGEEGPVILGAPSWSPQDSWGSGWVGPEAGSGLSYVGPEGL